MNEIAVSRHPAADRDDRESLDVVVSDFLFREAELLDGQQFKAWMALMSPDLLYRVPVRTARDNRDGRGFSTTAFFLDEDYASMKTRVLRIGSDYAWAENPATRTRRLVGNIRIRSSSPGRIECGNNLAIFTYRGDASVPLILTGEREDTLVEIDGIWKLEKRMVFFDATVLGLEALSIFL